MGNATGRADRCFMDPRWCELFSPRWQVSGIEASSRNWGEAWNTRYQKSNYIQMIRSRLFNLDSNCILPRFKFRVYMWDRVNISDEILNIWKIRTSWNIVSWSFVMSNVIPGSSWYLRKSPHVSWLIFKIVDFWWFLVDFGCSHVRSRGGECFAPPLIRKMSAQSFLQSNCLQIKNSLHQLSWFST